MAAFTLRPAAEGDCYGIARAHAAAWRAAFTFLPQAFLDALTTEIVLPKWQSDFNDPASSLFVATRGDQLGGFLQLAHGRPEVMSLYVDPAIWRLGVGSLLLAAAESVMKERGNFTAVLWTARDSDQSRRFYEGRGWEATGKSQSQTLAPGVDLEEVEYAKRLA